MLKNKTGKLEEKLRNIGGKLRNTGGKKCKTITKGEIIEKKNERNANMRYAGGKRTEVSEL